MSNWLENIICACCSKEKIIHIEEFDKDPLGWTHDVGYHPFGDFSMAAVYANSIVETHSQFDVGKNAFFVGIYDGFSGDYTSTFILANLFKNLVWHIQRNGDNMSEDILRQVVAEIEESVMNGIRDAYEQCPELGIVGSSCLICILWEERLYIANLGDSRAVMGSSEIPFNRFLVQQLVRDHNACNEDIRIELMNLHPDDPNIVTYNFDAWRVKGIREVSRGIGHAYWKREPFTINSSNQVPESERVPSPFTRPLLSAEPEIHSRRIRESNKFIIFGSGGLWKFLTNEEAAKIVENNPREGIAKRLVMIALEIAAGRRNTSYNELREIPQGHGVSRGPSVSVKGTRKEYHDDITVIVVFFDKMPNRNQTVMPPEFISFKAFSLMEASDFRYLNQRSES